MIIDYNTIILMIIKLYHLPVVVFLFLQACNILAKIIIDLLFSILSFFFFGSSNSFLIKLNIEGNQIIIATQRPVNIIVQIPVILLSSCSWQTASPPLDKRTVLDIPNNNNT